MRGDFLSANQRTSTSSIPGEKPQGLTQHITQGSLNTRGSGAIYNINKIIGGERSGGRGGAADVDMASMNLSMRARVGNRLKLRDRDVSPRKQVAETETMLEGIGGSIAGEKPWWRNVGMEEGM